jgi:hypothetical protein
VETGASTWRGTMVKWIGIAGWIAVSIGVLLGFYYLGEDPAKSLAVVTVLTAGFEGMTGWVRQWRCSRCSPIGG